MNEDRILLGHGSGGLLMKQLLDEVIFNEYTSDELDSGDDAAILHNINLQLGQKLAFSTDSFVVTPQFFAGGDIGRLAVCGTVNDVATSGAKPAAISASFILEEGYKIADLKKICKSMADAAAEAGVKIVTGDTKVVERGKVDGIFINTSGVGVIDTGISLSGALSAPGDAVIVSGTLGDHGITIMSEREGLQFSGNLQSDAAPLNALIADVIATGANIKCFRDPTRGGIASTLNEFAQQSSCDITINEPDIPINEPVKAACELLGLDPLHVANEGKMVCVCAAEDSDKVLSAMKQNKYGTSAAIIGTVQKPKDAASQKVYVKTMYGTSRILDMLVGQQLPRIC